MPDDKDKVERLMALAEEIEDDDLEAEMAGKGAEERMKIIEREGATREQTLAARARLREKMKEKLGAAAGGKPERSNVVELSRYRRAVRWAASHAPTGLVAAAAAVVIMFGLSRSDNLPKDFYPVTPEIPTPPVTAAAGHWTDADLERALAYEAYINGLYDACLAHLDKAKELENNPRYVELGVIKRTRMLCTKHIAPPE